MTTVLPPAPAGTQQRTHAYATLAVDDITLDVARHGGQVSLSGTTTDYYPALRVVLPPATARALAARLLAEADACEADHA